MSLNWAVGVSLLILLSLVPNPSQAAFPVRKLYLDKQNPSVLKYHNGPLLYGNITFNLVWYGKFTPIQRSTIVDFIQSLNGSYRIRTNSPTVASWWRTTSKYKGGPRNILPGKQVLDINYSLGKFLKTPQILALASKAGSTLKNKNNNKGLINVVLTSADVAVEDFCTNQCGTHGSGRVREGKRFAYAWVGNPESQCPGQCAWPFHKPIYGPQTAPLVAPNGDVGVDGMVISLATVLAGTVTNPFDKGYFQGPGSAPLEAVSACTGIFGKGAYPGYPGELLLDKTTGASYNAVGLRSRKYLLPAMWNPLTSSCTTLV